MQCRRAHWGCGRAAGSGRRRCSPALRSCPRGYRIPGPHEWQRSGALHRAADGKPQDGFGAAHLGHAEVQRGLHKARHIHAHALHTPGHQQQGFAQTLGGVRIQCIVFAAALLGELQADAFICAVKSAPAARTASVIPAGSTSVTLLSFGMTFSFAPPERVSTAYSAPWSDSRVR